MGVARDTKMAKLKQAQLVRAAIAMETYRATIEAGGMTKAQVGEAIAHRIGHPKALGSTAVSNIAEGCGIIFPASVETATKDPQVMGLLLGAVVALLDFQPLLAATAPEGKQEELLDALCVMEQTRTTIMEALAARQRGDGIITDEDAPAA